MSEAGAIFIVGITVPKEYEQEFNEWSDTVHAPMGLKSKWIDKITRYKVATVTGGDKLLEGDHAEYLTIGEFKDVEAFKAWRASPENKAMSEEQAERWAGRDWRTVKFRTLYEPIRSWTNK
jgi:antibiotic biosynthesis monooxygenase (ABM) superfamily enzyme